MKPICKKIFWITFFSGLAICIHKFSGKIKAAVKLSRALPKYLENITGESPGIRIKIIFSKLSLDLKFSPEIISKFPDLENTIREFIADSYPELQQKRINLTITEKEQLPAESEPEEIKTSETPEKKAASREKKDRAKE